MRTLEDIIRFNEEHKEEAMPKRLYTPLDMSHTITEMIIAYTEQNDLIKAFENTDNADHIAELKDGLRRQAKAVLDPVFQEEGIDIIAAPADSSLCIHAAAAGEDLV